jgi:RNA polymerase sigma factor (sigma-70 family)
VNATSAVEGLLRELAPQALGAVVRRYGHFDAAEDAVQEAMLAAAEQWSAYGVPESPRGWLIQVAARRMTDHIRSEVARKRREDLVAAQAPTDAPDASAPDTGQDDSLVVLFMCCHPALTPPSAIALTLRAVGGLTTAEIATAFLVPEATMAQRISRAKQKVKAAGSEFRMPTRDEWPSRLRSVLHVLYLIFNEGYATSAGEQLARVELSSEAIRLTRAVHQALPDDCEVAGLLALMLLTDARRPARTGPDGELVPLDEQDRTLWDAAAVAEGIDLITATLRRGEPGAYQIQAAIAAVHDEATRAQDTDWPQIHALYGVLERMSDNPVVSLNRAIAAAMVHGPATGLDLLSTLDDKLAGSHRLDAARAHLLEMSEDVEGAAAAYRSAARRTTSMPERNYLIARADRLVRRPLS